MPLPHDPHSYARPDQASVTSVSLDLTPDFATHRLSGTARLAIERASSADSIILDVRDLTGPTRDARGLSVYRFRLDKRIPPYLFALAVGDIAFQAIGSNTGVYAEPSVVDRAASEFAEVDQMVAAASKLYGPYRWGRYDILVLPPSFPFGGMENPTLTFATPTVLAGDRSLVSLVAHELAHS